MRKKLVNSQLCNWNTYQMYVRRLTMLAENVFKYKNLPEYIDLCYLNNTLLKTGSIAFFKDDVLGVIALPYSPIGKLDIYGRPMKIMARAYNGTFFRTLNRDEFVIMYDNTLRSSIYLDILQIAERIAMNKRTVDVNIVQQRTPRIWKTNKDYERTIKDLSNNIDGFEENVVAYDTLDIDEMQCVLAPAPFVADKVNQNLDKEWAEFFQLVGIAHLQEQKKERVIVDEMNATQGGTIAARFSRFESRKRAIDEINEKFGTNIELEYYDGEPTTEKEVIENDVSNVLSDTFNVSKTSD